MMMTQARIAARRVRIRQLADKRWEWMTEDDGPLAYRGGHASLTDAIGSAQQSLGPETILTVPLCEPSKGA